jgi:phosphatidate cytidylyltransferase
VPFNFQTFRTRALTALLFVAVMLAGLLWNFWSFLILFTVIHFGCWYEFVKLMKKIYAEKYFLYCLLGIVYISLPCLLIIDLSITVIIHDNISGADFVNPFSSLLPCGIIFSIWINDTSAYLVGSFLGKTPLTKISPKKTVEGTIGGAILCVAVISLLAYYMPVAKVIDVKHWAIIAVLCALFGTMGDLFESKLKRMADVKDSGSFMPGHGGFLDRFDSLLFAVPAVWIYVKLFL